MISSKKILLMAIFVLTLSCDAPIRGDQTPFGKIVYDFMMALQDGKNNQFCSMIQPDSELDLKYCDENSTAFDSLRTTLKQNNIRSWDIRINEEGVLNKVSTHYVLSEEVEDFKEIRLLKTQLIITKAILLIQSEFEDSKHVFAIIKAQAIKKTTRLKRPEIERMIEVSKLKGKSGFYQHTWTEQTEWKITEIIID